LVAIFNALLSIPLFGCHAGDSLPPSGVCIRDQAKELGTGMHKLGTVADAANPTVKTTGENTGYRLCISFAQSVMLFPRGPVWRPGKEV
jgi:hypothetical protein